MNFKPSKNDRPVFGKLASEYGLTYYGTVVPTELDDYIPVRGMTASPEQIDDNYTAGTVAGYNVQLLQRSHDVYLTDNRRVNRTWTICQADLHADDFASKFAVYVSPQDVQNVQAIFTPEFQAMLSLHFADTDFEVDGNKLYSYSTHRPIQLTDLDRQLRITIWLAKHIDNVAK